MQSLWNAYGTEALMALGGALVTALIMRLKAWKLGDLEEEASFARQFLAYTVGYAAALAPSEHSTGTCAMQPSPSRYRWLWQ